MFPIFMWIKEYKGIKNFHINLDSKYQVKLEVEISNLENSHEDIIFKNLDVEIKKNEIPKGFYGKNIEEINVLLGKNGTGKSSILEVLSLKENNMKEIEHLIIYKSSLRRRKEVFVLEGYKKNIDSNYFKFLKLEQNIYMRNDYSFIVDNNYNFIAFCNWCSIYKKKSNFINTAIGRFKGNIEKRSFKIQEEENKENEYKQHLRVSRTNLSLKDGLFSNIYDYVFSLKKEHKSNFKNVFFDISIKDCFEENYLTFLSDVLGNFKDEKDKTIILNEARLYQKNEIYENDKNFNFLKNYCNRPYLYLLKKNIKKMNSISDFIKLNDRLKKKYKKNSVEDTLESLINDIEVLRDRKFYERLMIFFRVITKFKEDNKEKNKRSYYKNYKIDFNGVKDIEIEEALRVYDSDSEVSWLFDSPHSELNQFMDIFICGVSDGEKRFLEIFSCIRRFIEVESKGKTEYTLIFDEIEDHLHPEWARKLLALITKELETKYSKKKFKLIFATHNPFLISDVFRENCLHLKKENGESIVENIQIETFGSNIQDLLKNGMFLESTFGEITKIKLRESIKFIEKNNYKDIKNNKNIEFLIKNIGEKLIVNKLNTMIESKKDKISFYEDKIAEYQEKIALLLNKKNEHL